VRTVLALLTGSLLLVSCAGQGSTLTSGARPREPGRPAGATAAAEKLPTCPPSTDAAPLDRGLPDLTLPCLGPGGPVTLSGLRGRPMVVNIWASWCPPCAREMPILERAHRRLGDRVGFLGVDLLDTREAGSAAAVDFGTGFPSVFDPDGRTRALLNVPGPPVTLFVRADGEIAYRQVGEIRSRAQLRALVVDHLGVRW
jgi:cytochrome c biogenesis protein CcmG, thiol:disulfide interchange protein DsbE